MAKTGAFSRVPKAPFLSASNTAPDRNPSICRALRSWVWLAGGAEPGATFYWGDTSELDEFRGHHTQLLAGAARGVLQ
jgi:hypothetical protein